MRNFVSCLGLFALSFTASAQVSVLEPSPEGADYNRVAWSLRKASSPKSGDKNKAIVFPGDWILPHLVDGAGWKTTLIVNNLETYRVTATLVFFSNSGMDLTVPLVRYGRVRGLELTLDPGATATLETEGTNSVLTEGWAILLPDNLEDSLGGMAVLRQRVSGRADSEAVVPIVSAITQKMRLLYDNTSSFSTAMAITSPGTGSTTIAVVIRNEDGSVLERKNISLGEFEHRAFSIPEVWPATAGRRGSIEFEGSGDATIGILGLRFNPAGSFTSFHTLSHLAW